MFYLNKDTELNIELLQKMINRFNVSVKPRLQRYWDYYNGNQKILSKTYSDSSKPCNKSIVNYCKVIADAHCGYIGHITYSSDNDIEDIMQILNYNDYQAEDSAFLLDALVYGTASELMYNDENGQTRFRLIKPTQCFGICDDSLTGDLRAFVRIYKVSEWDDSDLYNVDVYSDYDIKHYTMTGVNGWLTYKGEEPHYFNQCPANIFALPDEKSIFDNIITLQDTFNEVLSVEVDELNQFADSYLTLSGVDADTEDIARMKENRVLILPEGATAQWLTKNANDTQIENILKRIHDSIFRVSSTVDFSHENLMSGVASGLSIQYKMTGQEAKASKIEAEMKKALQRRIELICGQAALKLGEEIFRDIRIEFKRNIPTDLTAQIGVINSLKGTVSDATLLSQLDFINDVNAELERVQEQKAQNMALYSFGSTAEDSDE